MRIFRGKNWLDMLLGEMINLETGKLWFHLGKLVILNEGEKRADYPSFNRPGRTITITAAEGLIMLPCKVVNARSFTNSLYLKLEQKYQEAKLDINNVFKGSRSIQDGNQHFVTTRVTIDDATGFTVVTESNQSEEATFTARRFEFVNTEGSGYTVVPALFVWRFISPEYYSDLLDPRAFHPVAKQLVTIMCDEGNTLNKVPELANGVILTRNLIYADFKFWKILFGNTKTSTWGDLTAIYKRIDDMSARDRTTWMQDIMRAYDAYVRIKPHPNFTTWHCGETSAIQLTSEGIIYELHIRLGKGATGKYNKLRQQIDDRAIRVPYTSLTLTCQDTEIDKIKAHLKKLNVDIPPQQTCQQCYMPLWGESYSITGPDGAVGICRVCVCSFTASPEIKVFTHPTKIDSMLKMLPCQDPDYIAVLRAIGTKTVKPLPLAHVGLSMVELDKYIGFEMMNDIRGLFPAMWRYNTNEKLVFPYSWNTSY